MLWNQRTPNDIEIMLLCNNNISSNAIKTPRQIHSKRRPKHACTRFSSSPSEEVIVFPGVADDKIVHTHQFGGPYRSVLIHTYTVVNNTKWTPHSAPQSQLLHRLLLCYSYFSRKRVFPLVLWNPTNHLIEDIMTIPFIINPHQKSPKATTATDIVATQLSLSELY